MPISALDSVTTMLELKDVHVYYGQSHALMGVSLLVPSGRAVALLGRNGAGKTTTLSAIAGQRPVRSGTVTIEGKVVTGEPPHRLARAGLAFAASGHRMFDELTVRQSLEIAQSSKRKGLWNIERVLELFPKLRALQQRRGGVLSGGERQMLKVAQALLTNPTTLLLDEPTEGLAPVVVGQLRDALQELLEISGLTVLLSEQNVRFARSLVRECYVLERGSIRFHGTIDEVMADENLRYLLGAAAAAT